MTEIKIHNSDEDDLWKSYEKSREAEKLYLFQGTDEDISGAKVRWLQKRWQQKKTELHRMSFIKRFLTSDADEFMILKFIFGIPFGVVAAFVLYYTVLSQLEIEPKDLRMQFVFGFITFYALAFACSAGMRCVTFLLIPTMFGSSGRFYLYAVLLSILITGPLGTMISNGHEVFRAFLCGFNLVKNQTKISLTVTLVPLLDILINLVQNQDEFLSEVSKLGEQIKAFLDSMIYPELDGARNARIEISDRDHSSEVNLDEVFGAETQLYEASRMKHFVKEKVEAYFQVVRTKCQAMIDWAQEKCVELWKQLIFICCVILCIFFWVCFIIFFSKRCYVSEMPRHYLGYDCGDIGAEEIGDEYAEKILRLRKMVDEFFSKFDAKFQYEVPEKGEDESIMMVTAEQVEAVVEQSFAFKNLIIEFVSKTLMRCIPFLFVVVLYQSQNYLDRFITDITFDNRYITSYFVHIDNRRKLLV